MRLSFFQITFLSFLFFFLFFSNTSRFTNLLTNIRSLSKKLKKHNTTQK